VQFKGGGRFTLHFVPTDQIKASSGLAANRLDDLPPNQLAVIQIADYSLKD